MSKFLEQLLKSREDKNGNKVKANAFYIDFNAPQAGFEYKKTRVASR